MESGTDPLARHTVEVILPVKDMRDHALECARRVLAQLTPADRLTVIDDASSDGTAAALRKIGANVICLDEPMGPYGARHLAASRSEADVLLFVDGRSRPLPGWLEGHRGLYARESTALTCTGTRVARAPGIGPRVFQASNMFKIDTKLGVPGRLAFYPTANLGVRRKVYEAVGGFRRMRSGGDADLCWRVQLQGLGDFAADHAILMEWVPRRTLREVVDQWVRYGRSSAYLEAVYQQEAIAPGAIASTRRRLLPALAQSARQLVHTPLATSIQLVLDALNMAVYQYTRHFTAAPPPPGFYELPHPGDSARGRRT